MLTTYINTAHSNKKSNGIIYVSTKLHFLLNINGKFIKIQVQIQNVCLGGSNLIKGVGCSIYPTFLKIPHKKK